MSLKEYQRKRRFDRTPEPSGAPEEEGFAPGRGPLKFVVQKHAATRLHYDFRLEFGGTLKSWAVPKGPSLNPQDQQLAVFVEDHPLEYGSFEGTIPKGNYGAGTVMVWDWGYFVERHSRAREDSEIALARGLNEGKIAIVLDGNKLKGEFALIRLKDQKSWLFFKKRDLYGDYKKDILKEDRSVKTGRTLDEIASQADSNQEIWLPKKEIAEQPSLQEGDWWKGWSGQGEVKLGKREEKTSSEPPEVTFPKAESKSESEDFPVTVKPAVPMDWSGRFESDDWIFIQWTSGYRAIAKVKKGKTELVSRQGISYKDRFPKIYSKLKEAFSDREIVLDAEISAINGDGHLIGKSSEEDHFVLNLIDLLHLDGQNTRVLPLSSRLTMLEEVFSGLSDEAKKILRVSVEADPTGATLARHRDAPYESGTFEAWKVIGEGSEEGSARLTNLSKVYFPKNKVTKGDLIKYYETVADTMLPHLRDRPQSLNRNPDGVDGEGFFHKDIQGFVPRFVDRIRLHSSSSEKSIHYLLCQNKDSLLYMANLGCIEINPWLSRINTLNFPDFCVIDLDPDDNDFDEVIDVALAVHQELDRRGLQHYCKTSGSSGLHIYVPLNGMFDYDQSRELAIEVCETIQPKFAKNTSLERSPSKRRGKIYLDCFQNRRSQTLAAPYCVRPRELPTVSTPLKWSELKPGLRPTDFTIDNVPGRIQDLGDLFADTI